MKSFFLFLAISFGCLISTLSQTQNQLPDSILKQLKAGVVGFKDRYHSPSVVLVIVHNKTIIFSESLGYVDLENKVPATIDSKYPIMSVTKPFTATMLMQLRQRNVVDLDDDVKKYLPEFKGNGQLPHKSGISLLQLASHTSGLSRNSPADIHFTKQIDNWILAGTQYQEIEAASTKEFLQSLKFINGLYPRYEFLRYGDRHYSNLGYSMLGIALERAAKMDYATFILKNICGPLEMNHTGFLTDKNNQNSLARGYFYEDSSGLFRQTPFFKPNSALYAGGMYSTAADLAKFISFQFENNSATANKILSDDNKAMMQALNIGWRPSFPFVTHEGSMLGYRCEVAFNPEIKIGWVILTNTTNFDFSRMNEYISRLIVPYYSKPAVYDMKKYTGIYQLPGGYDSLEISLKNDSLYSSYLKDALPQTPLTPAGSNRFNGKQKGGYGIAYEFISDGKAGIKALVMGQLMWEKIR